MKYFSELTRKMYETEDELTQAEDAYKEAIAKKNKKAEEEQADWEEVQKAYNLAAEQTAKAVQLKRNFYKKYYGTKDNSLLSLLFGDNLQL